MRSKILVPAALSFLASHFIQALPLPAPVRRPLDKRIPSAIYGAGGFELQARDTPIVVLDNDIFVAFQSSDSNFVVYKDNVAQWDSQVSQPAGCVTNDCLLAFQTDGNLVSYFNGVPTWFTGTGDGQGAWLAFYDAEPYIVIYNADYTPIWDTTMTPPTPPHFSDTPSIFKASICSLAAGYGLVFDCTGPRCASFDQLPFRGVSCKSHDITSLCSNQQSCSGSSFLSDFTVVVENNVVSISNTFTINGNQFSQNASYASSLTRRPRAFSAGPHFGEDCISFFFAPMLTML
jgi:hypothetical protein